MCEPITPRLSYERMYWSESGNDPRSWITRIISSFISLFAVQNTSHFTYSCHFYHRVYHQLTMTCLPVGLFSPMDRAWRPVIVKVRVFQVLFQPPRLFIQLRGSFPLSYVYPQFKIWAVVSYIYIHIVVMAFKCVDEILWYVIAMKPGGGGELRIWRWYGCSLSRLGV